jgi:hypothetical protein
VAVSDWAPAVFNVMPKVCTPAAAATLVVSAFPPR